MIVKPLPRGGVEGSPVWSGPADAKIVETRRIPNEAVPAAAKTHNYVNGILARLELEGEDEALLLDVDGRLTEGTVSNLFFVIDVTLHTPGLDGPVLPGVTRKEVLDLAEAAGVPVETGEYEPEALLAADEAFLTNTTWEVRPVGFVDGEAIGDGEGAGEADTESGPVTADLARRFDELVEDRHY